MGKCWKLYHDLVFLDRLRRRNHRADLRFRRGWYLYSASVYVEFLWCYCMLDLLILVEVMFYYLYSSATFFLNTDVSMVKSWSPTIASTRTRWDPWGVSWKFYTSLLKIPGPNHRRTAMSASRLFASAPNSSPWIWYYEVSGFCMASWGCITGNTRGVAQIVCMWKLLCMYACDNLWYSSCKLRDKA